MCKYPLTLAATLFMLGISNSEASLVISQIYGGGGGGIPVPTYKSDYVELLNNSETAQNLTGYSIQYSSSTGTTWAAIALPNVTIAPYQYFLIQGFTSTTGLQELPLPEFNAGNGLNLSASSGKLALVSTTNALTGSVPSSAQILDLVGYGSASAFEGTGPAPVLNSVSALFRYQAGLTDTQNNAADFFVAEPSPRNFTNLAAAPVPLPMSLLMLGSAISGLLWAPRRTAQSAS